MDKKDFKPIGPFFGWVLENFPFIEVDFDAITNYELLCKVVEYINKIGYNQELLEESNNELIDAFNELKTYVESYLENLDVQGYVDNKLDEMAESGELSDLIEKYIQVSGILAYNTLDDLENATNLENGSFTRIFGKLTYNDGLGAYYKIRNVLTTDVIDGDNIIALVNYPELVGEKIFNKAIVDLQEDVGDIDNLNTTEKSNIVGAINEVKSNNDTTNALKTARNINGTSFDGSADITTSKWGLARTITIKDNDGTNSQNNTNIDGSSNFDLKLPNTIKASITGNCSGSSGSCTGNSATATKASQDADGNNISNTYLKKKNIATGETSITPSSANTPTSKAVTWSAMDGTPIVVATPKVGAGLDQNVICGVTNISSTGCTLWVKASNTSARTISYIAIYK